MKKGKTPNAVAWKGARDASSSGKKASSGGAVIEGSARNARAQRLTAYVNPPPRIDLPTIPVIRMVASSASVRAHLPRAEEIALVPDAIADIARFAGYDSVFGKTAPPQADVGATLEAAYGWTMLRRALVEWAEYAATQEAEAWEQSRGFLRRMASSLKNAIEGDPELDEQHQPLQRLLAVRGRIAKRAGAARAANAASVAAGKPGYAGAVGARRKRRALKATLAAEQAREAADASGSSKK